MNIEQIHSEARRLVRLLDDPQPGLLSWNAMLTVSIATMRSVLHGGDSTKPMIEPGLRVEHVDLEITGKVLEYVEGWWLVRFSDNSTAHVRPSRLRVLPK